MPDAYPFDDENEYPQRERPTRSSDKSSALSRMFGTWDAEQVREFNDAIAEMDKIDDDMWK